MSTRNGGHEELAQDAGAYVLGALTEPENETFRAHLESCASCREEVAQLQVVADALPLAAPQLSTPPELKRRIMAALEGELETGGAPARRAAAVEPSSGASSRWSSWRSRGAPRRWSRMAVPALAALAVVLAVIALVQPGGGTHGTRVVAAQVLAPGASASLHISNGRGQLEISGMPQVPPRHTYELWIQRAGNPEPTNALFTVSASGRASVGVPGSLSGVRRVLVTSEPLGGSRVPTSTPVLIAPVS
jgi:anti-sigma-K factor RskA